MHIGGIQMKTVNVGIIGCGGIAFGKHMKSLATIEEVRQVAFYDPILSRAEEAKAKFGTQDAKVYSDIESFLKDASVEVVHICTPNNSHAELTIAALEAGKHVNCEKPMAHTAADARRMYEASLKSDKKLTIGYQNRFRLDSQYLQKACRDDELGEIYFAEALAVRRRAVPTWGVFLDGELQGGGPLIDIGTHALDLTLWMMDNYEPHMVVGKTYRKLADTENAANAWGPWDPKKFQVEDAAFAMIIMKNGASIMLKSSWALNVADPDEAKCILSGTKGGADMKDGLRINGEKYGTLFTNHVMTEMKGVAFFEGAEVNPADAEMRSWIDAILYDREPVVTPKQAMVVSEILEAVYESEKTGKPVFFN
jgi:predicted dehydrogenase